MTSAVVVDNDHVCFVCHKGHALYACMHFDLGVEVTTPCVWLVLPQIFPKPPSDLSKTTPGLLP